MKYLSVVAIVFSLMCSCKEPEHVKNILPLEPEAVQTFSISSDTVIIGKEGTRIKFPQGCFVDSAGNSVSKPVIITLKEFYSLQDFVKNRLSTTTTDGQLLTSSGMIFLEAKSGTRSLQLKKAFPATIMFPRMVSSNVANLFSGERGKNDEIQWKPLDPVYYDTIVMVKETLWPTSDIFSEAIYLQEVGEVKRNVQFVIGPDTIGLTIENRKQFDKILSRTSEFSRPIVKPLREKNKYIKLELSGTPKFYIFETTNLGYINCDIFVKEELYPFTVQVEDRESDVFIIVDSLHSVIYPDSVVNLRINNELKVSKFFSLPKNKSITIVSYRAADKNRHYFGLIKSNTSKNEIMLHQESKTLDQIKDAIKQL